MKTGGLRAAPTPPGVPVMITSPGLQTHRDADHFDQRGDAEDELIGTRILHHSAVQAALMRSRWAPGGTASGVTSHGPNAPVAIEILAHRPLRRAQLKIAYRRIVEQRVPHNVIAHREPIRRPSESSALDYEAELAVVIGRGGRRIQRDRALDHVVGYSLFNDATIRDFQLRTPQWTMGKNFDATGAFGPWLVTPDAVPPGAHRLRIQGRLNGRVMQDASTDQLIFSVSALIEMISVAMSLEPVM